jgi:hypothetical protein
MPQVGWDSIWNPVLALLFFLVSSVFVASLLFSSLTYSDGERGVDYEGLKMSLVCSLFPVAMFIAFIYSVIQYRKYNREPWAPPIMKMTPEQTREYVKMVTGGKKKGLTQMEIEERMEMDDSFEPPPRKAPAPPRNHEVHGPFEENPHLKKMLEEHEQNNN